MDERDYLVSLERFGIKLGLENIARLLRAADDPHLAIPVVHVAGTNGKGSVVAMLDAIFHAAGYHTVRYTSPHLMVLNERFLQDMQPISDADLDDQIRFFRAVAETMDPPPTFFEFVTAMAFRWFAAVGADVALVEVGLGGRFDATNIVQPTATAITNIDLEHQRYLGDTLELIAFEKAGILKAGVPAVVGETRPGPLDVILQRAQELDVPVRLLDSDFRYSLEGTPFDHRFTYTNDHFELGPIPLGMAGSYQGENAALAVALVEGLRDTYPALTSEAITEGLRDARWPCRLEKVLEHPPVIIDVAHNHAGAIKLAEQLNRCVIVMAVSSDKAAEQMIAALAPRAAELILTQFSGSRALPVSDLCAAASTLPHHRAETLAEAIDLGVSLASDTTPLFITGSIFTAGEARALLIERHGAAPIRF